MLVTLPSFTLSWILLVVARPFAAVWLILLSRGLAGFAVGVCISIVPSYIISISSTEYQGLFALGPQLMISVGLLVVYILGAFLDWWTVSLIILILQLPILGLLLFVPDSPSSLLQRGKEDKSRDAVYWLTRSKSVTEQRMDEMIESMKQSREKTKKSFLSVLPLLRKASNWKPLSVSISLLMALQLCGVSPLVFFSVK